MLFNSIQFALFFPVVTLLYFLLPHRFRVALLLSASAYFYMSFIPGFILILLFTVTVDFFAGIWIEQSEGTRRRNILIASILANCGVLFVFKYFNFFNANLALIAEMIHWNYSLNALSIVLPIGLSFHTFQSLSYTIEVYRKNQKAERRFDIFALYVIFYPQLVAGPIERPQNLLHQFYEKHEADLKRIWSGLERMAYGFFKKLFIADHLAPFVNQVYDNPDSFGASAFFIATVFFAFQIYCDFSGYSDIALGSARVMGFRLMENFRQPYFSRSIGEFWRRWHISLSSWFKDYVYVPLGGSRVTPGRQMRNLLLTFALSGLWHGANWTYVIWGGLNGAYLAVGIILKSSERKFAVVISSMGSFLHRGIESVKDPVSVIVTFGLISITWVFFRAENVATAMHIIKTMLLGLPQLLQGNFLVMTIPALFPGKASLDFYLCIFGILVLLGAEYLEIKDYRTRIFSAVERPLRNFIFRWFVFSTAILLLIAFPPPTTAQFIYFQF